MQLSTNGIDLHYDIHGEGQPLLWLHGFLGCGADWRHIFAEPPAGYRIVAPDLRGHGRSSSPAGTFRFQDAARDVAALLVHLGLSRVRAIGLSGGGITLLHLATSVPDAVDAMVVISAPPYFPHQARDIMRATSDAFLGEEAMAQMRRSHARGESQVQELLACGRELANIYDDVNFTPPLLATIGARTMVVFGDSDPLYPVTLGVELHTAIPSSRLWVVPGGGHGPVFGPHAAGFRETAMAFLGGRLG